MHSFLPQLLFQPVEIGGSAAVLPIPQQALHLSKPCQIRRCPLDGGPGEAKVPGNPPNGIPTFLLPVGLALEVEENRLGPGASPCSL